LRGGWQIGLALGPKRWGAGENLPRRRDPRAPVAMLRSIRRRSGKPVSRRFDGSKSGQEVAKQFFYRIAKLS